MVSANHWLGYIKTYRLSWYLTAVSANHASSNSALDIINYSSPAKQQILKRACLEMPGIREERAQIGPLGLIKLTFLISRSYNFNFHVRLFEEEGRTFNLSREVSGYRRYKDWPFAFFVWGPFFV